MCDSPADPRQVATAAPRPATGSAVDPIALGFTVEQVVNPATGKPRGKGSHEVWALYNRQGAEVARGALTKHPGEMSWAVTRTFEEAFQKVLGEGWMDR